MELKSCPFCGDEAFISSWYRNAQPPTPRLLQWRVGCNNDQCPIGPHEDYEDRDKAIAAWNRRPGAEAARRQYDKLNALLMAEGSRMKGTPMIPLHENTLREIVDALAGGSNG